MPAENFQSEQEINRDRKFPLASKFRKHRCVCGGSLRICRVTLLVETAKFLDVRPCNYLSAYSHLLLLDTRSVFVAVVDDRKRF